MKRLDILRVAFVLFLYCGLQTPIWGQKNDLKARPTTVRALPTPQDSIPVIPRPMRVNMKEGAPFVFDRKTVISINDDALKPIAKQFATMIAAITTGREMDVLEGSRLSNAVNISIDKKNSSNGEGYELEIDAQGIAIKAKTSAGAFYALQTIRQLLVANAQRQRSPMSDADATTQYLQTGLPPMHIEDKPSFGWRGMMVDVCRHFMSVDQLKKRIDAMAYFKLNKLHLHLTDDQGWRIEIKRYPYLTKVGAKRIEGDSSTYGPFFYTQEEIKDIVAYAAERYIEVVPEIEMPGHGMAAIAAYPYLTCFPDARRYTVRNLWGVEDDVYCAGRESTYRFLADVIDEVAPLFPSKFFHIGGDECPKEQWKRCAVCQHMIRKKGLKDEHELQSYVIHRAEEMLARHGKRLIGWDEILEGGLAPSATVMSWRGESGGIAAARMGHDVVMTPASGGLYLDHYQGDTKVEPLAIGGYAPLSKTYEYYPVPANLPLDKHKHILGIQGNLWSEYMYTADLQSYRAFPRIIAVAETGWSPRERKDFVSFCKRLDQVAYSFLDEMSLNYHIPIPEQPGGSISQIAFVDQYTLRFQTSRPVDHIAVRIVDTPEDSLALWQKYDETKGLYIKKTCMVEAKSVMHSGRESAVRKISLQCQSLSPAIELDSTRQTPGLLLAAFYVPQYKPIFEKATDSTLLSFMREVKMHRECTAGNWLELRNDAIRRTDDGRTEMRVSIAYGYVYIPEDGVYAFATNNKELWIDDVLLIDNTHHPKKESSRDGSRALSAGYHPIKVIFQSVVEGGWPSWWDDGSVLMRRLDAEPYKPIPFSSLKY